MLQIFQSLKKTAHEEALRIFLAKFKENEPHVRVLVSSTFVHLGVFMLICIIVCHICILPLRSAWLLLVIFYCICFKLRHAVNQLKKDQAFHGQGKLGSNLPIVPGMLRICTSARYYTDAKYSALDNLTLKIELPSKYYVDLEQGMTSCAWIFIAHIQACTYTQT